MAKEGGMGWTTCSVDDAAGAVKAIVNDVTALDLATPRGIQDTTGLDKAAHERLLLLADFSCTLNGVFHHTTDPSAHEVFKTVPSTSVTRTVTLTISGQILACECLPTDYALSRAADGSFTWTAPMVLQSGTAPSWTT